MDETELIETRAKLHALCLANDGNLQRACYETRALVRGGACTRHAAVQVTDDLRSVCETVMRHRVTCFAPAANDAMGAQHERE